MPCHLRIISQVSIGPCTTVEDESRKILIMGPTGSGKSTFIEALAAEGRALGISKDQLDGFTKDVASYRLENVTLEWDDGAIFPIYLIDTPGFSDSKISEMEIINNVKTWMSDQRIPYVHNILYLCPVTDTRLSGSKRRTIKMLQALLDARSAGGSVAIVTTMWDRVSNPYAKERAEAHFRQLQVDIWKEFVDQGAHMARFENDHTSAIDIVRAIIERNAPRSAPLGRKAISRHNEAAPFLYQELLDRISNARQEKESLRLERIQLITKPDPLFESVVIPRLQEVQQDLSNFVGQLVAFGRPPRGFDVVPERIGYQDLIDHVNEAKEDVQALQLALDMGPTPEREPILCSQLQDAEERLDEHSKKLVLFGEAPRGFEQAIQAALAPPRRLIRIPASYSGNASTSVAQSHSSNTTKTPGPGTVGHMQIMAAETFEGNPSSSTRALVKNRFRKELKSFKEKFAL